MRVKTTVILTSEYSIEPKDYSPDPLTDEELMNMEKDDVAGDPSIVMEAADCSIVVTVEKVT